MEVSECSVGMSWEVSGYSLETSENGGEWM